MAITATATEAQAALVESGKGASGDIEGTASRGQTFRKQAQTHGVNPRAPIQANPRANIESRMIGRDIATLAKVPETKLEPILVATEMSYLFRSDPGHRLVAVRIPGVPQHSNEKHQAYFERQYVKKHSEEQRAHFAHLADLAGGLYVTFTPVARRQECYYETNEKDIADFIRGEIAADKLPQVYEDVPYKTIEEQTLPTHRAQAAMRLRLLAERGGRVPAPPVEVEKEPYQYPPVDRRRQRPRDPKTGRLLPKSAAGGG